MSRRTIYICLGIFIVAALAYASYYFAWFAPKQEQGTINNPTSSTGVPASSPAKTAIPYKIETFAQGLFVPWGLVFTSDNRMLVSERNGNLRVIENRNLRKEPIATFDVSHTSEEGLMGLAVDPDYKENKKIYACLAYESGKGLKDKVVSFTDNDTSIAHITTIIDNIPAARNHAGCRLLFLPDETLLVTTGDATDRNIAQDKNSLGGKILRLNRDGSIPSDNPFPNSPVWTFGHRNPQGIAFDPNNNNLWETEHGPSIFDGPAGGDEINLIEKGRNYGWPTIHHKEKKDGLVSPQLEFTPAVAPSGMLYYSASLFPQFTGSLFFTALKGEGIYRLTIDPKNSKRISAFEKLTDISVGRIRDIIQGSDGTIYFATSNRDGRGSIRSGDDKIYRLVPKN